MKKKNQIKILNFYWKFLIKLFFFHKLVELYSKNYNQTEFIGCDNFNNYAKELLNNSIFPKQTQNLWQLKIGAMSQEFVLFDNERRKNGMQIFS